MSGSGHPPESAENMLEDAFELRIHGGDPADRDTKLAIIDRPRPGRCLRDVSKLPLRVESQ